MATKYGKHLDDLVNRGLLAKSTRDGSLRGLRQAGDVKDEDGDRIGTLDADPSRDAFDHILRLFGRDTGAAETCLKALRAAYKWSKNNGFPKSGLGEVEFERRKAVGATAWKPKDIVKFLSHHKPGSMARLWFALADTTAGRIGDMNWLGPDNLESDSSGDYVAYQPQKRGSKYVSAPVQDLLRAELAHHDLSARDKFLVNDTAGRARPRPRWATRCATGSSTPAYASRIPGRR
ncbi:hypothetical protein [Paracoccus sp. (in: a-proteobacteria)]|uniref:hypothetical protein n=1 Tax=Paracoccus sp. TaxID=267 RepID=UPI0035B20612